MESAVSRIYLVVALIGALALGAARADTFSLTTGETISGDVLLPTANDQGVQIKVGEGDYQKVPWTSFGQEDLRKFSKIPKLEQFVDPFIEVPPTDRLRKTDVPISLPPRLERPAPLPLLTALRSTGLGALLLLILHAANAYTAYEVGRFRARPVGTVCGISACAALIGLVLGMLIPGPGLVIWLIALLLGPAVFLALPGLRQERRFEEGAEEPVETAPAAGATAGPASPSVPVAARAPGPAAPAPFRRPSRPASSEPVNPMQADEVAPPSGLHLAGSDTESVAKSPAPRPVVFQRGQFTFNRRFFETKFSGFFGVVRKEADRDMVLIIKAARGEYAGQRISRISSDDLYLEVREGHASQEVLIPFQEIKEIILKRSDS